MDLFKTTIRNDNWTAIENLGASINSSYDELGYWMDDAERKAFIASNRATGQKLDEVLEACCFDIYQVNFVPATIQLAAFSFDKWDSTDLLGVRFELIDVTEGDSFLLSKSAMDVNNADFSLLEDRIYKVLVHKDGWESDSVRINLLNIENYDPIRRNLYLIEHLKIEAFTFERTTNVPLAGVTVKLIDIENNNEVGEVTNTEGNTFDFPLLKGRDYKLFAEKDLYTDAEVIVTAEETATEGNVLKRNLYLELQAIADLRKLLPIRLYFDNDQPNPRSESDTTNFGFSDLYTNYYARKGKYMDVFTKGLRGERKNQALISIDEFFQDMHSGWGTLQLFMDKLEIILREGHSIDIFLKGFASPRAKSDYNQLLSARRVISVRNEVDKYRNGLFKKYLDNRQFKIKEIPFGESQAASGVSDKLEDEKNSIYSINAAKERRVEILEILKGVDN